MDTKHEKLFNEMMLELARLMSASDAHYICSKFKEHITTHYIPRGGVEQIMDIAIESWDNNYSGSRKECLTDVKKILTATPLDTEEGEVHTCVFDVGVEPANAIQHTRLQNETEKVCEKNCPDFNGMEILHKEQCDCSCHSQPTQDVVKKSMQNLNKG